MSSNVRHDFRPILSLWALIFFGLAFVSPTGPFTFYGIGATQSHGHFASVYLIALIGVSFTAASYGAMAAAFPEAGSAYAYASKGIHPIVGYFTGWVMILDYLLAPMFCVIIISAIAHKLVPSIPYAAWVALSASSITAINLRGIGITSRATIVLNAVVLVALLWFLGAAVLALTHGIGRGTLFSIEPFYSPDSFNLKYVMAATPIAVVSFLGFDGISTLAEDAKEPRRNVPRATMLVCLFAGGAFIIQTYFAQLIWPDYTTFPSLETAFSDIGRRIGGPALGSVIASLVIIQTFASGIACQASASRLLYGMARDGRIPKQVFGYLHPKLASPTHSLLLMGAIAMVAALLLNLEKAAELVNFGACFGFMAVNASVITYYFVRQGERTGIALWTRLISPAIGLIVCLWIWLSVSSLAMIVGASWSVVGVIYLYTLIRRRAFVVD